MEFRHQAKIEFNSVISVDEKMTFLNAMKTQFGIEYLDIVSSDNSTNITGEFIKEETVTLPDTTEIIVSDNGKFEMLDTHMYIKVELSFQRLVDMHTHALTLLGENVRDMVVYHNENPSELPSA